MKREKRRGKRGLSLWILLAAMLVILIGGMDKKDVSAGFGDYNDYDSGDWGSSDSYDWGSDYDYDSGSDYYYSSSDYDGDDGGGFSIVVIVVIIIIIYSVVSAKKNTGKGGQGTPAKGLVKQHSDEFDAKTFLNRDKEIAALLQETDPNFSADDFIVFVKNVYMDIQDAWCKRDLSPVRAILHENLYAQTEKQVEKKKSEGVINALESIAICTSHMTSARRDDEYEYIGVYLVAKMIDYQYKEDTKEVIRGNKTTRWELAYRMRFMRARGSQTADGDKTQAHLCPNCGAALPAGASVVCPYCGSNVNTTKTGWVLCEFQTVRKDMKDEGISWKSEKDKAREAAVKAAKEAAKKAQQDADKDDSQQ